MNADKTTAEACKVYMADGKPCGRPLLVRGSESHNGEQKLLYEEVCLMHFENLNKDKVAFWKEIDAILNGTSPHHRPTDKFDFSHFVFPEANFIEATFTRKANFSNATFAGSAHFQKSTFVEKANFNGATFDREAIFWEATFKKDADFGSATFNQIAEISTATFRGRANFFQAKFNQPVNFWCASFKQNADFTMAKFGAETDFSQTIFEGIARFSWTLFEKPTQVHFRQVNADALSGLRARFVDCEMQDVHFEDVRWHRYKERMVLQDEMDACKMVPADEPNPEPSFELVAIAYRRLVNNFERVRAYDLAEDCYVGAMEMKRLDPRASLPARLIVNIYKWLSVYGSSYTRALGVLGVLLLTFALLFALFGVRMTSPEAKVQCPGAAEGTPEAAVVSWGCAVAHPSLGRELWGTFAAGFWAAVEVATFQRNPMHEPATKWGSRLSILEIIVVPGQVALFFLALRRRFRR